MIGSIPQDSTENAAENSAGSPAEDSVAALRRAQLAALLKQRRDEETYQLSYPQQRLWFVSQLMPDSAVYNVPLGYRVRGPLDVGALQAALNQVVRRHEILRTVFPSDNGVPRQRVLPALEVPLTLVDLSAETDPRAAVEQAAREEARVCFDLAAGPLLRAVLLRAAPDDHHLCLTIHHICFDGGSVAVLGRELSAFYAAAASGRTISLPEPSLHYTDYAEWQQEQVSGPALEPSISYWTKYLEGVQSLGGVHADHARPAVQDFEGAALTMPIPPKTATALEALTRGQAASLFAGYLAAFAVLLRAQTGGEETAVGIPVSGRTRRGLEDLIGFFTNTVVLRLGTAGSPTFRELLRRAHSEIQAAMAHQDLPFEKLVELLQPERDLARNPLFQVFLSYREDEAAPLSLAGCEVSAADGDSATAKFDLTFSLARADTGTSLRVEYNTGLFDEVTIRLMAERYLSVLADAVARPETAVDRLAVLPDSERAWLLEHAEGPAEQYDAEASVPAMIEAQVARTPDAPAVIQAGDGLGHPGRSVPSDSGGLTYRALDEEANRFAARLRALGAGPGEIVGVSMGRSPRLVVTLLAILKSGAAYLPLDPAFPAQRLEYMVTDSSARLVVADREGARTLDGLPVTLVDPFADEDFDPGAAAEDADRPAAGPVRGEDLAYLLYTSGSTGRPKGVMVTHANVVSFFAGMDEAVGTDDEPGTWLAVTSVSFDISVVELLWALTRGHRVAVREQEPAAIEPVRPVELSLLYFGSEEPEHTGERYRLLMEGARFADRNGFTAVWTPERHFHSFGGRYPSPSVLAGAVAAATERVRIRAGSVVLPLHDSLRVAEEWSVVDNLSGGRAGISFASGWHTNDFVLAPDDYATRREVMQRKIEEVRKLWAGGAIRRRTGAGNETDVRIFPPPVQPELPFWLTSARSPETFRLAGELGAGLLTHLLGHSAEELGEKIALYRQAWREHGHPGEGHVTLMLHTFVGEDLDAVREICREPLVEYLKTSIDLIAELSRSVGREADFSSLSADEVDALARRAFDRFFDTSGLLGTPETCLDTVERLSGLGVDEIACLIDFGVAEDEVLAALGPLGRLGRLVAGRGRPEQEQEHQPIAEQLTGHQVTHLQCTPSLAGTLVADPDSRAALSGLRRMLVGGEALPGPLAEELAEAVPGSVHNMYGPTEATVWATTQRLEPGRETVPIGRPMANVRAYVADSTLELVPRGVPGELLLGGPGVAAGYLGQPELTAQRFVEDPFGADGRLYRTGDLVRWNPAGELEFLGRMDGQIKLRGHRIELGEIENALLQHPGVAEAVAVPRGEGIAQSIAAYCVPVRAVGSGPAPTAEALRAHLAQTLPGYMIPAAVVILDAIARTPNGKIDRKALPEPTVPRRERAEFRAPGSEAENRIAAVWREVLRTETVGLDDNFFEIGGNSLLIAQLRTRLREETGREFSLVDMFRYPTVGLLAAAVEPSGPELAAEVGGGGQDAAGVRRRAALGRQGRLRRDRRTS